MTTAAFPALDRAHAALLSVASVLTDADLPRATPCSQWNVAQVLQHAAGDQRAYAQAITGQHGPTDDPFAPSGALEASPFALVAPAIDAAASAFAGVDPAAITPTPLPHGDLPARTAAGAAALDAAVHAWDLAVATGRPSPLDDDLAAQLLPVARSIVEPLRQWGAYAAVVPSDGTGDGTGGTTAAPAADELLRYLGREPRWAPPVVPARVAVLQADLDDLRERLVRTRFAETIKGADDIYGTSVASVRDLVRYWIEDFDWRAVEDRLNAYPQFETVIDGQKIHFLHVRSGREDAVGLILTHGWPGSVLEYLDVIEPLTTAGYDVVLPSLPGFGFSGPTTERGWEVDRTAAAWVRLMGRLGYERYGAVGNDGGSMISPEVGRLDPEHVVGVHVTQLFSFPSGDQAELADLTADEQSALEHLQWFWQNMGAFNVLQSQSPQTLAHALADSPAGLLGWNSQLMPGLDAEFVVANAAVYWLTGTAGSALRFYYEMAHAVAPDDSEHPGPTTAPTALAAARGDFASIRRFADRHHANIVRWTVYEDGNHYQAHVAPEQLAGDVVRFFDELSSR
jgi:uncharacterized protein (TIGR03086 family)